MQNHWLEQAQERLRKQFAAPPSEVPFERLRAMGLIDDEGRVTGHVHRWDADLAVIEASKPDRRSKRIATFRCFKPVFGIPGGATIDVARDSFVDYLMQGKKIITAHWDERLKMWREGSTLRLTSKGGIRIDQAEQPEDDVGPLAEFSQVRTSL